MAEIISMPKLGFDMAEGTLVRWVVAEGEKVEKGAVLAEIETDKATVEVESTHSGVLLRQLVEAGAVVPVNTPIAVVGAAGETVDLPIQTAASAPTPAPQSAPKPAAPAPTAALAEPAPVTPVVVLPEGEKLPGGLRATPLARRLAEERGVDLRQVTGSGPQGRIRREDVLAILSTPGTATRLPIQAPQVAGEPRADKRVPLTKLRQIIGRRMVESVNQSPHFYVTHLVDMARLMDLRSQMNALLGEDEKTSVNDYIVKAAALALVDFPNLNALLDEAAGAVIQRGEVNIGVAVAVPNGLLTVVCRDADRKPVRQISAELRLLASRAREGKVRPEDIEGSTFSVSNLGMFDVEQFTAIINPPEAAILAVGSVRATPVVVNGAVRPGQTMKVTLSVDHRVSDGAEGARFLQALAKYLEEPLRLAL